MVKVSIHNDVIDCAVPYNIKSSHSGSHSEGHFEECRELSCPEGHMLSTRSLFSLEQPQIIEEAVITRWLEQLLRHFGIHELKASSDRQLMELMASCESGQTSALQRSVLQDAALLSSLKQRIMRLAGAQLDTTFMSMAPDVVNIEDAETISLEVESRLLKGIRYQDDVYRLVEAFAPCHRLQAFCLGQTMQERGTAYLITRSSEDFSVWVNVLAFPSRCFPLGAINSVYATNAH